MKKVLACAILVSSVSAGAHTYTDEQTWINVNAFVKLDENWIAYAEYQPRFFDYSKYNGVTLHRGAIGRNIGHGLTAWAGYGFMTWNDRQDSKFPSKNQHEDRPFLQLSHVYDFGNWRLSNRTRVEQRMFRHDDEASTRVRHQFRAQYKFNDSPWAIAIWDEYFYNTNSIKPSRESHAPVLKAGFDQNRAFIGPAYFFGENDQHMVESGYMNNYVHGATRDRNAHVWMTTVTLRF